MTLSREQLVGLSKKSISNARALIEEAELLFERKHWARAVFLCHTAGEEFGKSVQCMSATMDLARGRLNWQKFWKRFMSHRDKTMVIDAFETAILGDEDPWEAYFEKLGQKAKVLTQGRNATLYASPMTDGTICEPADLITKEIVEGALNWAKGRLGLADRFVVPLLESKMMTATDDEIKELYHEFSSAMQDPKQRDELKASFDDFFRRGCAPQS